MNIYTYMWVTMIWIDIWHIEKCDNHSLCTVPTAKSLWCAWRVFMCPFHWFPYKSCHKYPLGKYVYMYGPYFPFSFPIPITNLVHMRDLDSQLKDKVGQKSTPRPLVHLHQQLKTPLLPGRPDGSSSMGHAVRDSKSLCTHCCVPASERFMNYISGSTKWLKWTKQKEILEISPECRVKGQLPHLEGGDGKKGNGRQILESPRECGTCQPWEGTFPRIFKAPDVTLCINHFLLSSSHQGWTGVGEYLVKGGLVTQPFWAQFRVPVLPLVPLGGVTYLIKTRQVTQMSYAALYKHLALLSVTIYSCVYMSLKHIFLHQIYRNAVRTISTPGQFTHMLPQTV